MELNQSIGYVITETATTISQIEPMTIIKNDKSSNRVIAEGILQEANEKNRNGRFYDAKELFPQLTCSRTMELLNSGNLRAENGHPLSKELVRQQTIDPDKTVAIFLKLWTDGNFIKAHFRGTNDARGEEFNQDLLDGFSPSWSLRALGRIVNTSRGAEVNGVKLITWDRVIYPSHPRAYTSGIISESAGIVDADGSKLYIKENDEGIITPITNSSVLNYIKSESANYKCLKESFELVDFMYDNIKLINDMSQVQLTDSNGSIYVVNVENYIHNEIMNSCCDYAYRK